MKPFAHRGRQRLLVLGAVLTFVMAWSFWPDTPQEAAYAAQQCGAGDANRASLTTEKGVHVTPCLSKVNLKIFIPRTTYSCGLFNSFTCVHGGKWKITGVMRSGGSQTVKFADGSTEQLYRLSFREFRIWKEARLFTQQIAGEPEPGYTLNLLPDNDAFLGGVGSTGTTVWTDLWVTGDSRIGLDIPLIANCDDGIRVDAGVLALTSIINITSEGCWMDLNVRYLVTTAEVGDLTGKYSVRLPNTTIRVDP